MYCGVCGCENTDTAKFCKRCGEPLRPRAEAVRTMPYDYGPRPVDTRTVVAYPDVTQPYDPSVVRPGGRQPLGLAIKVAIGATVLALGVVIALFVIRLTGSASNHGSAEEVASAVTNAMNSMFSSDLSDASAIHALDEILNLLPPGAKELAYQQAGITDSSELQSLLGSSGGLLGGVDTSQIAPYLSMVRISCTATVGEELSPGEIDAINKGLQDSGLGISASAGNRLELSMEVTALEDLPGMSKGQTETAANQGGGMAVINVDGAWYLWGVGSLL